MARGDQRHSRRGSRRRGGRRRLARFLGRTLLLLLVVAIGAGVAQWRYDWAGRYDVWQRLGLAQPDPVTQPAKVRPPRGLRLPEQPAAAPVAPAAARDGADPAAVRRAIATRLRTKSLGRHVGAVVTDLSGRVLYEQSSGSAFTPASTTKLLTSLTALDALGPERRFHTDVRRVPHSDRLVLVGGGDPFLASTPQAAGDLYPARASTLDLARRTAADLRQRHVRSVRLAYDASMFSGPAVDPDWPAGYLPDGVVPPISALWTDEGVDQRTRAYVDDPALLATQTLRQQLRDQRIKVTGRLERLRAPRQAQTIARVESAPLGSIVQHMLNVSDNNATEVIGRHLGLAVAHEGSFQGTTRAVRAVLGRLHVPTPGLRLYDASGLSRRDRIAPQTLAAVIRTAAERSRPGLRQTLTGLSVAGYDGSLHYRFELAPRVSLGRVWAKTGTLEGVHALAGVAVDREGTPLVFAIMADHVRLPQTVQAIADINRAAAALADCRCSEDASRPASAAGRVGSRP